MTTSTLSVAPAAGGVHTVRRVIMYLLLGVMVIIAAIGLSGLLERLFTSAPTDIYFDNYGLAQSLAFTLIAGPLAGLLWWLTWRNATNARDRASLVWPVYLVIMSTVALLTFTIALFTWGAELVTGRFEAYGFARGIVWGLVWLWHYWMWRHPRKGPTRMVGVVPAIASLIGLTFAAGGLVFALASLIDSSLDALVSAVTVGAPPWQSIVQSLIWAVGGGVLWWWNWFRVGVRAQATGFANVLLVYIAGYASFALVAFGITMTLVVVLELVTGSPEPLAATLDPLGVAIASAAIGALVLVYHARVVATHSVAVVSATRLVSSGASLAVAATGIGVTVNALLATLTSPLIDYSIRNLLLGGISALLVGGALWWVTWRPVSASAPDRVATGGRRTYLVVIFGVSALVALITLLVIGFQLFSFILDGGNGESFIERSRQALGLLAATLLVAVYHFTIWQKDRASSVTQEHVRRIERVTLVTAGHGAELAEAIRSSTGARVTVLKREETAAGEVDATVLVSAVVAALDGVEAHHVLVVPGGSAGAVKSAKVDVIRLAD